MNKPTLTVRITSFSFKKGLPNDPSGNGGGYVFDCRCIPNPGIIEEYKQLTGLDSKVITYLEDLPFTQTFISHITEIAKLSIARYIEREFTHIMFNFGCTGGQHRSVFFAETLYEYVRTQFPNVSIVLQHREQNIEKTL